MGAVHALAADYAAQGQDDLAALWRHFALLCDTPRRSKHEGALRQRIADWAQAQGLAHRVDAAGNLILAKPASPGCEDAPGVILQGHIDMVCQANAGTRHDFATDAIQPLLRDGWLIAEHTTLGADNGIGVALALAVLESSQLRHGPLEVLLTVDEEDGMGGAQGLAAGALDGKLLLNLDTEDFGEFYIGCAGGLDANVTHDAGFAPVPAGRIGARISVDGLRGGHSGMDIDSGRGNANKLLVRVLQEAAATLPANALSLAAFAGGTARNAIAREATALLALPAGELAALVACAERTEAVLRTELAGIDEGVRVRVEAAEAPAQALVAAEQAALLKALHAAPIGARRMSLAVPGVVETSNNLGTMRLDATGFAANLMVRSLVDSAAQALGEEIASLFALAGCEVALAGHYPGWRPNAGSPLLARCRAVFAREFGATHGESRVKVIHAGLECGIIGAKYPQLDMVSFGPDIRGAHAPGERVEVESVARCWHLLSAILGELTQ